MKTAMQLLFEKFDRFPKVHFLTYLKVNREGIIEKEKEQIIAAGNFLPHDEQNEIKTPEEYYNQTYNN